MSIHSLRFKKLLPIISLNKHLSFQSLRTSCIQGRLSPISSPIDHQSDLFMGKCLSGLKHTIFQLERFASFFFRSMYSQLSFLSTSSQYKQRIGSRISQGNQHLQMLMPCSLPFVSAVLNPWIHQSWYCMCLLKKTHI